MKKVEIWTDGCCKGNPGVGGYGAVLLYYDKDGTTHKKELKQGFNNTTNNRMELLAAIEALKLLKYSCDVDLHSDSKYLVDAFNQDWVSNWEKNNYKNSKKEIIKNKDLWTELISLSKMHNINFIWVKGHDGIENNERCDDLANEALKSDLIDDNGFDGQAD